MLASLVLYGLTVAEAAGFNAFLAVDLAAVGDRIPVARLGWSQALHWASAFDARLLGCPTLIIQQH